MPSMIQKFVEQWLTEFDLQAIRDLLLESLAAIAFVFLLIVLLIAMTKSPILNKHGSIEMLLFVVLGLIHSAMNIFDEFAWIGPYDYWKLGKDLTLLLGALLLVIGFFRFFKFSSRLFGKDMTHDEDLLNEEKLKEQM